MKTNVNNIHFDDILILYLISFMFFVNKKEVFQELKIFCYCCFYNLSFVSELLIYSETINIKFLDIYLFVDIYSYFTT